MALGISRLGARRASMAWRKSEISGVAASGGEQWRSIKTGGKRQ
jgi:hypothetical protein